MTRRTGADLIPKRLVWRLVPAYLLLIAAFTALILGSLARSLRTDLLEQATAHGLALSRILGARLATQAPTGPLPRAGFGEALGLAPELRLTLIASDGRVLADSWEEASAMESHADRPEVRAAFATGAGHAVRFSETVGRDLVYGATPQRLADGTLAVVRVATPVGAIDASLARLTRRVGLAAGAVGLVAVLIGWAFSVRMARQLDGLRLAAERFAAGDFSHRVPPAGAEELQALGRSLERMARQLDERLSIITAQSHERQAVLASMSEALIAVDRKSSILSLNGAAIELLGASGRKLEGQPLQAALREARIARLVVKVLETERSAETETELQDGTDRRLLVRGSVLRDAASQPMGVVLVLEDVTRLRRLERMRQEFVANVSHELRTPVTSIKGFVETLLDGGLEEPERARHFLEIVERQAERLHAIIEDLLTLSRLENESGGIERTATRLRAPLAAAVEASQLRAEAKGLRLELDCLEDLQAEVNAALLGQAVSNLVDNAVKFGERGGTVQVAAELRGGELVIEVRDEAPGIPREHLGRLFERFYRVDRARSRAEGGTGLGLAIVKHIAQAHGGSVTVRSELGKGSTFEIRLPRG